MSGISSVRPATIDQNLEAQVAKTKKREIQESFDLSWGSIDKKEILRMLTAQNYEFEISDESILIKNQAANFKFVSKYFDSFKTETDMRIECSLSDGKIKLERKSVRPATIIQARVSTIDQNLEAQVAKTKKREIQESFDLSWGSIDKKEILRMLTAQNYEFEISDESILIKNQAANFKFVSKYFDSFKTETDMRIECSLSDGKIKLERLERKYDDLKYARPLNGYKKVSFNSSEAASVMQGKFMISDGSRFHVLGTYGAGPCLIMAVHCPTTKTGALAHLNASNSISSIRELINRFQHPVDVHFFGGNTESKKNCDKIYQAVKQLAHVTIKNSDILPLRGSYAGASLAINVQTGEIYSPVEPKHLTPEKDELIKMKLIVTSLQFDQKLQESKLTDF